MNKLTAEQQISKAKVALMNEPDWRWMAGILMMGTTKFDNPAVTTAATDGLNEIYDRDFVSGLCAEQTKFVVLHENFHKMFRHLFVWQELSKENHALANIACDAVINTQYLHGKPGIKFIDGGVLMPEYADKDIWNTRAIFEDLKKRGGKPKGGHDTHQWEEAKEISEAEAKDIAQQIDATIRQATVAGDIGAGMPRGIREMLVPPVDWRDALAEFVKSQCVGFDKQTWRAPHRTYLAHDLYMPSSYSDTVGRLLIAGDTSGSINDKALSVFLGYMQQLCDEVNPDGIDIAWWDTEVASVDTFERGNMGGLVGAVKPSGGGGTDPSCLPIWAKKEQKDYVCAIVITDGEFSKAGDWGDLPVLWLVINDRPVDNITVGRTIHIKEMV